MGISDFSTACVYNHNGNCWRMRNFHLIFEVNPKLPPLVAEIGWTHNYIILEKCKDNLEREFYIRMTLINLLLGLQ